MKIQKQNESIHRRFSKKDDLKAFLIRAKKEKNAFSTIFHKPIVKKSNPKPDLESDAVVKPKPKVTPDPTLLRVGGTYSIERDWDIFFREFGLSDLIPASAKAVVEVYSAESVMVLQIFEELVQVQYCHETKFRLAWLPAATLRTLEDHKPVRLPPPQPIVQPPKPDTPEVLKLKERIEEITLINTQEILKYELYLQNQKFEMEYLEAMNFTLNKDLMAHKKQLEEKSLLHENMLKKYASDLEKVNTELSRKTKESESLVVRELASLPLILQNCDSKELMEALVIVQNQLKQVYIDEQKQHAGVVKSLQQKLEKAEEEKICMICCDPTRRKNCIFLPCNHICSCYVCASKLNSCPICRKPIQKREKVYV